MSHHALIHTAFQYAIDNYDEARRITTIAEEHTKKADILIKNIWDSFVSLSIDEAAYVLDSLFKKTNSREIQALEEFICYYGFFDVAIQSSPSIHIYYSKFWKKIDIEKIKHFLLSSEKFCRDNRCNVSFYRQIVDPVHKRKQIICTLSAGGIFDHIYLTTCAGEKIILDDPNFDHELELLFK